MKNVFRSMVVLFVVLVGYLAWGVYSDLKETELKLNTELKQVKEELKNETQQKLSYEKELGNAVADKLKVEKELEGLKQDINELKSQNSSLTEENEKLKTEVDTLKKR